MKVEQQLFIFIIKGMLKIISVIVGKLKVLCDTNSCR